MDSGDDHPAAGTRAATELAVLTAATELLELGHPFAELKIAQIAARAGISRTAFYFYFKDKRELLMRLAESTSLLFENVLATWWTAGGEQHLERAIGQTVMLFAEHTTMMRAVIDAAAYDEDVAAFWRALVGRFVESTQVRLEAERGSGAAAPAPPAEGAAFVLCWMTERACYQAITQQDGPSREELERALVAVWRAAVYGR